MIIASGLFAAHASDSDLEKYLYANFVDPAHADVDLSITSYDQIVQIAQVDAQHYFQDHPETDEMVAWAIGRAHAIHHHLLGMELSNYSASFRNALRVTQESFRSRERGCAMTVMNQPEVSLMTDSELPSFLLLRRGCRVKSLGAPVRPSC
jgi:hypothetical protein